jgi:hypothetical protein
MYRRGQERFKGGQYLFLIALMESSPKRTAFEVELVAIVTKGVDSGKGLLSNVFDLSINMKSNVVWDLMEIEKIEEIEEIEVIAN